MFVFTQLQFTVVTVVVFPQMTIRLPEPCVGIRLPPPCSSHGPGSGHEPLGSQTIPTTLVITAGKKTTVSRLTAGVSDLEENPTVGLVKEL